MPFCTNCGTEVEEKERFCANCGSPQGDHKEETVIEDTSDTKKGTPSNGKHQSFAKFYRKAGFFIAGLVGCFILIYGGLNLYNNLFALDENNGLSEEDLSLIDNALTNDDEKTYNDLTDESELSETNNEIQEEPVMVGPTEYLVAVEGENRLHIRQTPGVMNKQTDDIINKVYRGHVLHLIDNHSNNIFVDNYTWWEISDPVSGVVGWVAAEYLHRNNSISEYEANVFHQSFRTGIAAIDCNWIYYTSNDGGSIYRINVDSNEVEKVNKDDSYFINVADNWIYYSNRNRDFNIYRIQIEGSEHEKITNDRSRYLNVVDDWVYYINDNDRNKIYRVRLDGNEREKVIDDKAKEFFVADGWIFYSNYDKGGEIHKVRLDGSDREKLNDDRSWYIFANEGWVYFSNLDDGYKIYRVSYDGSKYEKINNDNSYCINVIGDYIYYSNNSDYASIYKINIDGSGREKINDEISYQLNVVSDWIYFANSNDDQKIYRIRTDGSNRQIVD